MKNLILLSFAILIFGCEPEQGTHEIRKGTVMELKAEIEAQTISIEKAKYLARQSYRNGYVKGAMQTMLGLDALETLSADSIAFERLLSCSLNQLVTQ